jgi:uncharacterized membrane protein YfcA
MRLPGWDDFYVLGARSDRATSCDCQCDERSLRFARPDRFHDGLLSRNRICVSPYSPVLDYLRNRRYPGGLLLLNTDEGAFRALVPFLILFATILFMLAPHIASLGEGLAARRKSDAPGALATGLQGLVAIYGGYFGAGMGIMTLASLSLTEGRDFHALNAAKNWLACIMQGLAVVVFILSGANDYRAVAIVATASILGGWGSVAVGRLVPQRTIRWFVIATGLALSCWYFVQ